MFQTGLRSAVGGAEPNHLATFRTASNEYSLAPGQDELVVTLDWVGEGPISARKTYTFRRGQLRGRSHVDRRADGRRQLARRAVRADGARARARRALVLSIDSYSFKGPVLYDGDAIREARRRRSRASRP